MNYYDPNYLKAFLAELVEHGMIKDISVNHSYSANMGQFTELDIRLTAMVDESFGFMAQKKETPISTELHCHLPSTLSEQKATKDETGIGRFSDLDIG